MANANRRFGVRNFAIFATAAAAVLAVGALAHQPDLDAGRIALSIGAAPSAPVASLERHADQRAVNPLAAFLQRWTTTVAGAQ
jgi:hypothetical protein